MSEWGLLLTGACEWLASRGCHVGLFPFDQADQEGALVRGPGGQPSSTEAPRVGRRGPGAGAPRRAHPLPTPTTNAIQRPSLNEHTTPEAATRSGSEIPYFLHYYIDT